jgi:hypothetical protein
MHIWLDSLSLQQKEHLVPLFTLEGYDVTLQAGKHKAPCVCLKSQKRMVENTPS